MFKSLFIIITAVMTLSLGFQNGDSVICSTAPAENRIQLSDDEINCLDNECFGYGQGHQCDDKNRPLCALDFNAKYSCYDAYAVFESDKNICLTFDQGYENGYTAPILDTLKEKNAKAIFFLTGDYARRNPELVKRMIDEGHIIANHGYDHASLPSLSIAEAEKELKCNHDYVKETYGVEMTYFRPPCGEYSEKALAVAQKIGYKTLVWSFAYCDWDVNNQPDVQTAFNKITGSAHGGEIVLLHSVSSTNAAILGDVIDSFRAQGYEIALPA